MDLDGSVRAGARVVAVVRVGVGLAAVVAPRAAPRLWVGETGPAGAVLGRAAGVRDLALGAGVLLASRHGPRAERTWVAAGAVCDAVDAWATLTSWRALPTPGRVLAGGGAVSAAAVGLLAARRLR